MHPPRAPREPVTRTVHGDTVADDYAWMADRDDPRLLAYLEAENAYAADRTAHLSPLVERIFGEIRSRTVETDLTVPVAHGGWWYYTRTVEGREYAVHARVRCDTSPQRPVLDQGTPPAGEQVLLDGNVEAAGRSFFSLGALDVSPDGGLLAWAADTEGDERYALAVRDLATGRTVDDAVRDIGAGVAWSLDASTVFYTRLDEAYRPFEVWRHRVGTAAAQDALVVREDDERFFLSLGTSKDDRWVLVASSSKTTSEVRLLDAADPQGTPRVVAPRHTDVLYDVEPCGDGLLVVHNARRDNFEVAWAPTGCTSATEWVALDLTSPDELVGEVEAFERFVTLSLRRDGLTAVRVVPRGGPGPRGFGPAHDVPFEGECRRVGLGATPDPASPTVQVIHESMTVPPSVYDYDVDGRRLTLLKQRQVPGYDPGSLLEWREWAIAPDGARVPISLVRPAEVSADGTAPGLLTGYGAYGFSSDPGFSVARLSLLDRGVVCATAHVRGGTELGWGWYVGGRLEHKEHTFEDFVACGDHLVRSGWVAPGRLGAQGASAGGLLMGAVANRAPGRFRVVHAEVPFVDVLTTILDKSLPLTVTEWEEWGNPVADPTAYARIKGYAPYDNVARQDYPALLVTTSLHDVRVFVTEPAKWVARLRATATSDPATRPILFRTELTAGHAGRSGRYEAWRELAWEYAVLLDLLDLLGAAG
ncbi:MAG: S9 family peptidase [Dermatophilaceae bacterium]